MKAQHYITNKVSLLNVHITYQIIMILPGPYSKTPRIQRECNILSKTGQNIHVIYMVSTKSEIREIETDKVIFHHIWIPLRAQHSLAKVVRYFLFYSFAFIQLLKLFKKNNKICIHSHHIHSLPLAIIFKRIMKCKVIYDAYEFYYFYFKRYAPQFLVPVLCKIEETLGRGADLIITCWKTQAEFLLKRYKLQSVIFPNLPPPDFFQNKISPDKMREKLGISSDDFIIFHGGGLAEHCKLNELLDAQSVLINKNYIKNIKLLISGRMGQSPILESLKNRAKRLGIEEHCIFLSGVPYKEISNFYRMSNVIYVMYEPIYDHLLLPTGKMFEAMVCKRPLITCNFGEKMKIVKKAKCGLAVKPQTLNIARALLKFINNKRMAKEMGMNGYNYYMEHFSWEKHSNIFLSAYEELLSTYIS